eukprot:Nitzschia sp. Nitz4//scaffold317_size20466//5482//7352//NITZ4_008661-RA/size20466-augustus-gene-0.19-mRNA-1//-1//CDS//3329547530//1279//frame0
MATELRGSRSWSLNGPRGLIGLIVFVLVVVTYFQQDVILALVPVRTVSSVSTRTTNRNPLESNPNHYAKVFLAIDCPNDNWQRLLRKTYLRFYATTGRRLGHDSTTICSWNRESDFSSSNQEGDYPPPGCRIMYTFLQTSKCTPSNVSDSVCLHSNEKAQDGNISSQVAWFEWANRRLPSFPTSNDWMIGYTECKALLRPPLLIDILDQQESHPPDSSASSSLFATTDFVDYDQCNHKAFRQLGNHDYACSRSPQARVYWMSTDLVLQLLSDFSVDPPSSSIDLYIREKAESHLGQSNPNLRPSIIYNTLAMKYQTWQKHWFQQLDKVAKDPPTPTAYFWKNLPCVYVTAKFGPKPQTFQDQVLKRRQEILWNFGWTPTNLFTYYDFPSWIINDSTWTQHLQFRTDPKHPSSQGGGYWFWKAPLIQHHLRELQLHPFQGGMESFLLYSDIDVLDHMEWLPLFLETFLSGSYDLAIYQMKYKEVEYTSTAVLNDFCDHSSDLSGFRQHSANFMVLQNTAATRHLIDTWLNAVANYDRISGVQDSAFPVPSTFKEHRHDQSMLSTLLNCKYIDSSDIYEGPTTLHDWTLQMVRLRDPTKNER